MIVLNRSRSTSSRTLGDKRVEEFVAVASRFVGNNDLTELQNRKIGMRLAGYLDDTGFIFSSILQLHRFY